MHDPLSAGHAPANWQSVVDLLNALGYQAGLQRTFPESPIAQLSLLEAIGSVQVAADERQRERGLTMQHKLTGLQQQLQVFHRVSHCPVVAITGLLNAGKSSLLATYLSPEGRARVLRGVGNQQGTHRFVIWLPKVWWSDSELLNTLTTLMTQVFGNPPEQLSEDCSEAQEQYNGRILAPRMSTSNSGNEFAASVDPLSVPLLASDRGLDDLKLGLLDCPDIETGFISNMNQVTDLHGQQLAAHRRDYLAKVGRLCSAFLVVSKLSSLHDDGLLRVLTTLRDAMPGVPRMLAINKVKARYAPEVVADEARALTDRFGISATFMAYDYRSAFAADRIPPAPNGLVTNADQPQPIFFAVQRSVQTSEASRQQNSPTVDYLFHLSNRLDAGRLASESHRSLSLQLQAVASESIEWMNHNMAARAQQISSAWTAIAKACYDFMAERDSAGQATGLRLQASPKIIAQLVDSLQRTAPGWMRPSLRIDRTFRSFQQAISDGAARFKVRFE
jgi:hypothetical protein